MAGPPQAKALKLYSKAKAPERAILGFDLFDKPCERLGMVLGKRGERLAVYRDIGLL